MIDCLIFSRDRPLQLDGLLDSIARYAPDLFDLTVLTLGTSPIYQLGYLECAHDHRSGRCVFWRQGPSFEEDVREWLGGAGEHICFLVDDDLFIRHAPGLDYVLPSLDEVCYSLRLHSGPRRWRWRNQQILDLSYPLALDGHIFRRETIVRLLEQMEFTDPTQLEAGLASRAEWLPESFIAAANHQCLVGIPANRVSPTSGMPHMGTDVEELCLLYLDGWRLDPGSMLLEGIDTAHADVELAFAKRRALPPVDQPGHRKPVTERSEPGKGVGEGLNRKV